MEIKSYPKVVRYDHFLMKDLLKGKIIVEEKIDGSQFSFKKSGDEIIFKSRGAIVPAYGGDKLFRKAIDYILTIKDKLNENWTYRGEVLSNNKHNVLQYQRTPKHNFIGFDIELEDRTFLSPIDKKMEFERLDFETVPLYFEGEVNSIDELRKFLDGESILGGQIEGIVIKNYNIVTQANDIAMGKLVRDEFIEVHKTEWASGEKEVVNIIAEQFRTEARWEKAVQHLRELGLLTFTPKDIPLLLQEVSRDVYNEENETIKDLLFKYFWGKIHKGITKGIPEWYKEYLNKDYEKNE